MGGFLFQVFLVQRLSLGDKFDKEINRFCLGDTGLLKCQNLIFPLEIVNNPHTCSINSLKGCQSSVRALRWWHAKNSLSELWSPAFVREAHYRRSSAHIETIPISYGLLIDYYKSVSTTRACS